MVTDPLNKDNIHARRQTDQPGSRSPETLAQREVAISPYQKLQ